MFEAAEVGHRISKAVYARAVPKLRADLLEAQYALKEHSRFPVVVVIGGVDGGGKGETVNKLNEWMDPRHIRTSAFGPPVEEEREHPRMWRYWMALPPKGTTGVLFGSWYTEPILDRVRRRIRRAELDQAIEEINRFEQMLADEGALVVKLWFHLSKDAQRERLRQIDRDPLRTWRVTRADWKQFEHYDEHRRVSEHVLRLTSFAHAPWHVVEGSDARYRELAAGRILLDALRARLAQKPSAPAAPPAKAPPLARPLDDRDVLVRLDLSQHLADDEYDRLRDKWQERLARATRHRHFSRMSVVVAFEGMDAAGKGGSIRRVTAALDARLYRVIPVSAPTDEERAYPYLWRFWRQLPRHGRIALYDRSWYGRVLVERVENFCTRADWLRAYAEINDFEDQLAASGAVLAKCWLQISKDVQLRRFRERARTRFKRFKITPDDWRNRKKWDAYQRAAADMIERTSTGCAPWTLVEANDERHARIKVLKTLVKAIEAKLESL